MTSPISGSIVSIPQGVEEETGGPARRHQFMTPRFETLKKQAQAVMESSGEAREALLIVRALNHLREHSAAPGEAPGPDLVDRDERQLSKLLTVVLGPHTAPDRQCIAGALSRAGGKETLARLEAWTYEREADREWLEIVISRLRHYESARHTPHQPKQPPPIQIVMGTQEAREALENSLANYEPPSRKPLKLWCDALEVMTTRDPYYVATYLRDFDPSVFYGYMAGQNIAVWYATHVRQNRVRCFQTLATAKHPGIALAGAAYLLHEDSVLGTRTLESWADADGPLRIPAAQLLVAHGQLDFVPVMFERTPPTIAQESIWQSFQAAMATLSNAAHNAKVPQPLLAQGADPTGAPQDSVLSWWQSYEQNLTPDPLPVQWPPPAE